MRERENKGICIWSPTYFRKTIDRVSSFVALLEIFDQYFDLKATDYITMSVAFLKCLTKLQLLKNDGQYGYYFI